MNILIPDSWLREYLQTDADAETIAREVSLSGPSVERIEQIEGESVYDVEITTNRVDSACIRGFAREAAVILQVAGIAATFKPAGEEKSLSLEKFSGVEKLPLPEVKMETESVKRILAVVLDQVQDVPTPPWMAKRLRQIGENVHSSVIDITNYITHELGHPCHAFDYDKVMALGGQIIIKNAQPGQEFVTLDGETHRTFGGEVVFTSQNGEIIDLPAIKGTLNTAIDEKTKRVLFWLENMDAMTVRQASMRHAIRTWAAILNEKNVDPALASETMARGLQLLTTICQTQLGSMILDRWPAEKAISAINLRLSRIKDYLGVSLDAVKVREILTSLGFAVEQIDEQTLSVTPPSFRQVDITAEVDLIEEVARLYGYHNLPGNLDFSSVALPFQPEMNFALERKMVHFLAGKGLSEVYTYSMVSEKLATAEGGALEQKLKLSNPLNDDLVYLRQKLVPSLEQIWQQNEQKTDHISGIFELAKVYFPGKTDEQTQEKVHLAVLSPRPLRQVRAWLDQLLHLAYLQADVDAAGAITIAEQKIGEIGVFDEKTYFELDLHALNQLARRYPRYQMLKTAPPVKEDLTFKLKNGLNVGELIKRMLAVNPLLQRVTLKDVYQQNYTFSYFYQADEPLSNEQIAPIRAQIVKLMADAGGELIGKLE
ncbi:MAG: phenylalanine--tRNA ligase subunit beta [bacterium]|nr:phenylalanine--tRNA ligase subunit beta [bacterium]